MRTGLLLGLLLATTATPIFAQTPTARAQILAGEFSKFKNETRTKKGASVTKYKEVVSEAWLAASSAYAGTYFTDDMVRLEVRIDARGQATGSGRDGNGRFDLRNLQISGGLITGTKAYEGGRTEKFEGVLLKRSTRSSAQDNYAVHYGIGMLSDASENGVGSDLRVFAVKQ